MTNNHQKPTQVPSTDATLMRRPNRRAFLITAGSACSIAALAAWRPSFVLAASGGTDTGTVTIIQFSNTGKLIGKVAIPRVAKSEEEWQQKLSPISLKVTRHAGTERPFTGSTWDNHDHGLYRCICCDNALFSSETKFESGTGWPSFWQPIAEENVVESRDESIRNRVRTAVSCRECDAHLGHVFDDGPQPTGDRYCMNSAAMRFIKTA